MTSVMTSVITGDIMNSRGAANQGEWLTPIKKVFAIYGKTPKTWEIYRGDSFQLEVKEPPDSLLAAIRIKACIKSIREEELDVRMAIGIGSRNYSAARITESNGEAFIHSGEKFETLKKMKKSLAIKSPWPAIDTELNLMISLASIAMDKWSPSSAELVALSLKNKEFSQKELGHKLGRTQSSISERQKRALYDEIMELEHYYRNKMEQQLKKI
ncbi:MAG: transcriptional regulator [Bacteroidota bacterium]|nr:transcriptional regulator [Bacteroidota bacterium]